MPMPTPAELSTPAYRLRIQMIVVGLYLFVAISLLFSAWRVAATTEMIDHVLARQTEILSEIRDARATIPAEVKSAIPNALRGVVK